MRDLRIRKRTSGALVFDAIRGEDGVDLTVQNHPFNYKGSADLSNLRVGYIKEYFDSNRSNN